MKKNILFVIFSVLCIAQGMLAGEEEALSLQLPNEPSEDVKNEFDFDAIEPSSPRSTVFSGRQAQSLSSLYPLPSSRYVPHPHGSRSPIVAKPCRASVPSPLSSVQEECNSCDDASDSDDERSQNSFSPRKRSDSLLLEIKDEEFGNAADLVKDMVYEGRFSPLIAEQAGNTLRSLSLSPRTYKNISPNESVQNTKKTHERLQLVSIINGGLRANPVVASAFKSGNVNIDKLYARVERILKANN